MRSMREILEQPYIEHAKRQGRNWHELDEAEKKAIRESWKKETSERNRARAEREAAEDRELERQRAEARKVKEMSAFMDRVPPRYKEASLRDFSENNPIAQHVLKGGSALILGNPGTGKTRLIYAIAKELIERDMPESHVRIVNMLDLLADVKEHGGDNWPRYTKQQYGKSRYLFIDELDKTNGSNCDYSIISDLVSFRYNNMLATVIAGNGSKELAVDMLGPAVFSRITGRADGGALYEPKGEDRRRG